MKKLIGLLVATASLAAMACGSPAAEATAKAVSAITPSFTDYPFTATTSTPYSADLGSASASICGLTTLSAQFNQVNTAVRLYVSGGDWLVSSTVDGSVRCFNASDFTSNPSSLSVATVATSSGSGYKSLGHATASSDCLLDEVSGSLTGVGSASVVPLLGAWVLHTGGGVVGEGTCLTYSGFTSSTLVNINGSTASTSCGANCKDYSLPDPSTKACFITGVQGNMSGNASSDSVTLSEGLTQDLQVTGTSTLLVNVSCLPF